MGGLPIIELFEDPQTSQQGQIQPDRGNKKGQSTFAMTKMLFVVTLISGTNDW
jgi:hypothetical protein